MKKLKVLFLFSVVALPQASWSNPESAYDILAAEFKVASEKQTPIEFSDVGPANSVSPLVCVAVSRSEPNKLLDIQLARTAEVVHGRAEAGPLLPATPDTYLEYVAAMGDVWRNSSFQKFQKNTSFFEMDIGETHIRTYARPGFYDWGQSGLLFIRKSPRGFLIFSLNIGATSGNLYEYGYCYAKTQTNPMTFN